jgi:hypothetical protein
VSRRSRAIAASDSARLPHERDQHDLEQLRAEAREHVRLAAVDVRADDLVDVPDDIAARETVSPCGQLVRLTVDRPVLPRPTPFV